MRDYFAELNADAGLIRRVPDFEAIYLDTAGPEPALPDHYVAPDAHLTRETRTVINRTNMCRAIQERPDLTRLERNKIIVRLSNPHIDYPVIP